jgi:hypothetical protein
MYTMIACALLFGWANESKIIGAAYGAMFGVVLSAALAAGMAFYWALLVATLVCGSAGGLRKSDVRRAVKTAGRGPRRKYWTQG